MLDRPKSRWANRKKGKTEKSEYFGPNRAKIWKFLNFSGLKIRARREGNYQIYFGIFLEIAQRSGKEKCENDRFLDLGNHGDPWNSFGIGGC